MGCCQNKNNDYERIQEIQTSNIKFDNLMFEGSPKQFKLDPINLQVRGDIDLTDAIQEGLEHQVSLQKFDKLQKKFSSKDQKPTMVSETVIIDLRRASLSSPSRQNQDKSSRNLNQKFIGML